jgi:hypothetical protein
MASASLQDEVDAVRLAEQMKRDYEKIKAAYVQVRSRDFCGGEAALTRTAGQLKRTHEQVRQAYQAQKAQAQIAQSAKASSVPHSACRELRARACVRSCARRRPWSASASSSTSSGPTTSNSRRRKCSRFSPAWSRSGAFAGARVRAFACACVRVRACALPACPACAACTPSWLAGGT